MLLVPAIGGAVVTGTYPSNPDTWRVYGKAVQLGASLVTNFTDYRFNDKLLAQSSDTVQTLEKIPADAVIKKAYLFWAGSAPGPIGGEFADQTASLQFTDGFSSSLTADNCILRSSPTTNPAAGKHFYCRKDVTTLLSAHPGNSSWNGSYTVGSVNAKVAQITTQCNGLKANQNACPGAQETVCCQPNDPFCQGRHASWSLLIIYDTKFSESVQRDIFLWDGFVLLDEQLNSTGQITIPINNFFVGDPPQADLMYYAMEGDKHLGEPIQSSSSCDSTPCGTCYDYIAVNGTKLTGGAGNSDANNIFNSTPETSVDLDRFDISQLVKPKDTSATILVSSGDGDLTNNQPGVFNGYGELVMYGYTVVEVNRLAPNYKNPITKYTVNAGDAAPGDTLTYTVDLLNSGQLDASPTLLSLDSFPPPGTDYVPGTTLVDGKTIPDVGGTSAISTGLSLGNVTSSTGGNSSRKVQFKVKVKAAPGVPEVLSTGKLNYTYKGDVSTFQDLVDTNQTVVKIVAPTLATPILVASSATVQPGGTFTYTLSLENASGGPLVVDEVLLSMPAEVNLVSVVAPAGGTDQSSTTGGANKTGVARITNLQLGAGSKVSVTITAKLKSATDLQALGAKPLNGYKVNAQAAVTVGTKVYQSDDPNQAGAQDLTVFSVSALADLKQSSKEGLDLSPATPLSAGDEMQFSITIVNSGLGDVTVNVSDPLPAPLEFISSTDPEIQSAGGIIIASNVLVKAGQTKALTFKTKILASVQAGTSFSNAATLSPTDGSPPIVVKTGTFTVTGGPDVTNSTKTISDLNGGALEPGDTVRYTIVINNNGKLPSGTLTVTDPVPTGLEQVNNVSLGGSFNATTNAVTWTVPSVLANGGKRILTFDAKVSANVSDGTTITNEALIDGPELKGTVPVSTAAQVEAKPVISTFSLAAAAGGQPKPGDTVTFTLKVRNTGKGPVSSATLSAALDPSLEFVSASNGGILSGGSVSWSLASIVANAPELVLTFTTKLKPVIAQGTQISTQVSLQGQGLSAAVLSDDPVTVAPADATQFQVNSAPIVTLTKSFIDLNGGSVQGGDQVEFVVEVANTGDSPATSIIVTDQLNPAFENVVVTGGSAANGLVSWATIGSLSPGDPAVTVKVRATVKKATASQTQISNQAKATFTETPSQALSNTVSFSVVNQPDFGASTKSVSAATIAAGTAVTWSLEIVNSGNQQGTNIVVSDVVSSNIAEVVAVGGSFNATNRTATWSIASLAAGAKQTLTLQGKVVSPLANGTKICNQGTITANGVAQPSLTSPPNADPASIGTPTCFEVSSAAKLVVTKDVFDLSSGQKLNSGLVKPGATLRYDIVVRNDGNDVATGLNLSDAVPSQLTDIVVLNGGSVSADSQMTWPAIATLAPGSAAAQTRSFTAKVKPALDNGLAIDNQALLQVGGTSIKSDDSTTAAADDPTRLTVISNIDLSQSTKAFVDDNGGDAEPGDKLTWTIVVSNQGDAIAKAVQVSDKIDPRLDQIATANGGVLSNGVITWTLGDIAPGTSTSVNYSTVIKSPQLNGAEIPNQAEIIAQGFQVPILTDADLSTAQREPTVVIVSAKANLAESAWTVDDLNGGTVEPGDEVVFTLTVKNTGDALATNTALKALLSSNQLVDIKPFDGGQISGDSIDWSVPVIGLSPGGDVPLRFSATVKTTLSNGDKITIAAQLPGVTPNPSLTIDVISKPDLTTSTLAVDDETGWLLKIGQTGGGHTLRMVVNVVNSGKVPASNLTITLPLGDVLTDLQLVTPGTTSNGSAVWTLPKLAAGGSAQFVVRGKVSEQLSDGFTFTPVASLTAAENSGPTTLTGPGLTVLNRPILKVTKSAVDTTGGQLFPGDTVRFAITIANVGNAAAEQLVVTDDLTNVAVTEPVAGSGGTVAANVASWTIAKLESNQTVTVNLDAKVGQSVAPGGKLVNIATAKASVGDLATSNTTTIEVNYATLKVEALYVPQAPAQDPLKPGDEVLLRAVITADGTFDAFNSEVALPIDTAIFELIDAGTGEFNGPAKTVTFKADKTPSLAQLKPNEQAVVNVKLRVKPTAPNDTLVSTSVAAREGQTKLSYSSAPATVKIVSVPELDITKTVQDKNGGKVRPLDVLRYEITVRVKGKAAALNAKITDALPDSLELIAVSEGGVADSNEVQWTSQSTPALATINPGDEVKLELEVRVRPEVSDGTEISNQALATADAVVTAVASDDPKTTVPGDSTKVTVTVNNPLDQSTLQVSDDNGAPLLVG
ncbi:MAG TPA: hypothetical protein DCQ06_06180, partial [Myxococcales bacterium]|nr:hypothetical protein [Myxococcales bacterium]